MKNLTLFDFRQSTNTAGRFYCSAEFPDIALSVWIDEEQSKRFNVWFKIDNKGTHLVSSEQTLNKALEKLNKVFSVYCERYAKLQNNII